MSAGQRQMNDSMAKPLELPGSECSESEISEISLSLPYAVSPSRKRKHALLTANTSDSGCDLDYQVDTKPVNCPSPATSQNGNEVTSLVNSIGMKVSKTVTARRKRLAAFASTAIKVSEKRYEQMFSKQKAGRERVIEEYEKQVCNIFKEWECDIHKAKDDHDELESILRRLHKILQQREVVHARCKSLRSMHEKFMKKNMDLSKVHKDQRENIHRELRKELSILQEKMITDSRREDISNMRKSLQAMLSQV